MERIYVAQEAIYVIAFINALWACCLWDKKVVLKKSTIKRLKWVMISLDVIIALSAIVAYAIDPYFLFADWVIAVYLALAVLTQVLTIRFLRERIGEIQPDYRVERWIARALVWLDEKMGGTLNLPENKPSQKK